MAKGKHPADEMAALPAFAKVFPEQLVVPGLGAERCIVWLRSVHRESAAAWCRR
jgi:16S rRNA (guanine527-N7)-methyltransferase